MMAEAKKAAAPAPKAAEKKEAPKAPAYEPDGRDVQLQDEVDRLEVDLKAAKAYAAAYKKQRKEAAKAREEEDKNPTTTV
jgi:elongation factor P hydroxylase